MGHAMRWRRRATPEMEPEDREPHAYRIKNLPRYWFAPGHHPRCTHCANRLPKLAPGRRIGQVFVCNVCGARWKLLREGLGRLP